MLSSFQINSAEFNPDQGQLWLQSPKPAQKEYLLTSWDQGISLFQNRDNVWVWINQGPNIRLLWPSQETSFQYALESFCALIPEDIKSLISVYKWGQLSMLRLLCRAPQAIVLAQSCPNLLWLLAHRINNYDFPLDYASDISKKKKVEILDRIIGHGSNSLVKILNKLRPSEFDFNELRLILQVLESQEIQAALRHCREIHLSQLAVVMEQAECVRLPLVRSLLEESHHSPFMFKRIKMLVRGCLYLAQGQDFPDLWTYLGRCRSVSELGQLYEQLNAQYNQRYVQQKVKIEEEKAAQAALLERLSEAERQENRRVQSQKKPSVKQDPQFPQPPFPGNEFIKPITTPGGLRYEGSSRAMNNCLGSKEYINKIARGEVYIYRVYKPQRATLEIKKTSSGKWSIAQLKLKENQSPKSRTKKLVQDWLRKANQTLSY